MEVKEKWEWLGTAIGSGTVIFLMFTHLWEGGRAERGTEDLKQALHCSREPAAQTHEVWDHDLSWNREMGRLTDWATQGPLEIVCVSMVVVVVTWLCIFVKTHKSTPLKDEFYWKQIRGQT